MFITLVLFLKATIHYICFMKLKSVLFFFSILLLLSSCVEIIDDVQINNDGSGTFKYTINLSASKVKINSILALDSLDGQKVPSKAEITDRINAFSKKLSTKAGITNVQVESNMTDFVFKLQCNFTSVTALQNAIKEIIREESKDQKLKELDHNWMSWDGNKLIRSIPDITIEQSKKLKSEDIELLKQGNYTSITRFERSVDRFDNENAVLSKNKQAVMIKTNPYLLSQDYNLLENTIYLVPNK
jgi:hypothetical protein